MVRRTTILTAVAVMVALGLSGCSSSAMKGDPGVNTVQVSLTDAGCDPPRIEIPAGRTRFEITNKGATAVTEFEVLDGTKVLGERENLTPGLRGDFSITLKPGTYTTYCPNGKTVPKGKLLVTG